MRRSRCLLANNANTEKLVYGFYLRPKKFVENILLRFYPFFRKVFMNIDIVFIIVSAVLILIGTVGTVVPVLPGVPFAWAGLLVAFFFGIFGNFCFGSCSVWSCGYSCDCCG